MTDDRCPSCGATSGVCGPPDSDHCDDRWHGPPARLSTPKPGIYRYDSVSEMRGEMSEIVGDMVLLVDEAGEQYEIEVRSAPHGGFGIRLRPRGPTRPIIVKPVANNSIVVGTIADYRF